MASSASLRKRILNTNNVRTEKQDHHISSCLLAGSAAARYERSIVPVRRYRKSRHSCCNVTPWIRGVSDYGGPQRVHFANRSEGSTHFRLSANAFSRVETLQLRDRPTSIRAEQRIHRGRLRCRVASLQQDVGGIQTMKKRRKTTCPSTARRLLEALRTNAPVSATADLFYHKPTFAAQMAEPQDQTT